MAEEKHLCICGCDRETKMNRSGKYNKYIYGHNNKNKIWSNESNAKRSNKMTGRKNSEEHNKKISIALTGKKRGPQSKETRDKIGAANKISNTGKKQSEETRLKRRLAMLGKNTGQKSEKTKEKLRIAMIGRKNPCKEETRQKLRIANTGNKKCAHNGANNPMYGKPCPYAKGSYYNGIYLRSAWEVKVAQLLDKENIKWQYEPKRFYYDDFSYLPDFYLPDHNLYIEVKGWIERNKKDRLKIDTFINNGHKLLLIQGEEYKKLLAGKLISNFINKAIA